MSEKKFSLKDPVVVRAFEICAERGLNANNILDWITAVSQARKEGVK